LPGKVGWCTGCQTNHFVMRMKFKNILYSEHYRLRCSLGATTMIHIYILQFRIMSIQNHLLHIQCENTVLQLTKSEPAPNIAYVRISLTVTFLCIISIMQIQYKLTCLFWHMKTAKMKPIPNILMNMADGEWPWDCVHDTLTVTKRIHWIVH
jgi:hypothetical protein